MDIADGVKEDNITALVTQVRRTKRIITFEPRSWNSSDKKWWISKYNGLFSFDYLSKNHVYPVERYWIDSYSQPEPKYYYTTKDPCYAYYEGQDDDKISNIRLYFPNRSKHDDHRPKFISNNSAFQCILDIEGLYDYVVLAKSKKDALALRRMFDKFSFTGNYSVLFIAYPSENYIITDEFVDWILTKLKEPDISRIINFTDFDFTGRKLAKYASDTYGIPYVFLTNGEFGLPNHGVKDFTDFVEKYGVSAAASIIDNYIINTLHGEERYIENIPF